jgi:UDP-glucose 4-epimerase
MKVLVTGGSGYIGSHTVVELLEAGIEVLIVDNFSNSKPSVIRRIQDISGCQVPFVEADIRDRKSLRSIFSETSPDAVIHFAGLKAVGDSVRDPLAYYANNVLGSITLFECMAEANVKNLVFSSSATVYGEPETVPVAENAPLSANSPYGRTKLQIEFILRDLAAADVAWRIGILRYFNPAGAHPSGYIGEDPGGIPNNLMPFIARVAVGQLEELRIFGDDYDTPDGTGIRDYIHVVDLAKGHLAALEALGHATGVVTLNLGTGRGYSVMETVRAFSNVTGRAIPYRIVGRRAGDVASCYADPAAARLVLGWQAERNLHDMCGDAWRWQQWAADNVD